MPGYGVLVATQANNQNDYWVYDGSQATVHGGGPILLVNGCDDVASGSIGWAGEARQEPVWALYDAQRDRRRQPHSQPRRDLGTDGR